MRIEVLRRAEDFRRLRGRGRSLRSDDVVLVYLDQGHGTSRVGVVASRRVGGAVRRNRAKRLLREAHRRLCSRCIVGFDLILIARAGAPDATTSAIEEQLAFLYKQAGMLDSKPDGVVHVPA